MKFCVIGLGRMGRGIAINLLGKGHVVYGYDVDKSTYPPLINLGLRALDDLTECPNDAEYVVLALPTGNEVLNVIGRLRVKSVILDTTTMGIDELGMVLNIVNRERLNYLTVRLEGGPKQAESGTLVMFVGGDEELYRRSEEALKQLGTPIYVGSHEQATLLKLITTSIIIANTAILAELVPLIKELNLNNDTLMKALTMSGADSAQLRTRLPWMLSSNYPESFSIKLAKYVIDQTIKYAINKNKASPLLSIVSKILEITDKAGLGKRDFSEMAELNR
ncbi:MAG: NAD(P)-dependent oxidoreductase [Vulcanisaeta sp.]|nr:NAD(P)-dependent oxidoreductase [Vulcanisaeta sp.]MCG2870418.1 NAD(P)-dependent oxidoreductase [Vulcanisaeta sp.]